MALSTRGFRRVVTFTTTPVATGRSEIAGRGLHPLGNCAFPRRTGTSTFGTSRRLVVENSSGSSQNAAFGNSDFGTGGTDLQLSMGAATGNTYVRLQAWNNDESVAGPLVLQPTNSSNSFLGIGNTSPTYKLDVAGLGHFTGLVDAANFVATSSTATSTFAGGALFATGAGNVGIGTTSPTAQLSTTGTVRFSNFGAGTLQTDANGNLSVSSDERLKNVQGNFSRGLADIEKLTPILYQWKPETGYDASTTYAGFSAQNVQAAIPEAVGQDGRGYLTLQDRPLIAALVNAEKEIASITGTFKTNLIAWLGDASNGIGSIHAKELCAGATCVNEQQLAALLAAAGQQATASTPPSTSTSSTGSSTPALVTLPVIEINGANPATLNIGDAYADLGATITAPDADKNLGILTFLNGSKVDAIQLDTSTTSTNTIDYVVTDQFGTTATATRTLIVKSPAQ